mmetsp:Transcript_25272/g.58771  ORF Transcript_25272/g.58771 Transcript_25272/m.58771 type:complete len:191 (+) Transcript_25272:535-1107(+)
MSGLDGSPKGGALLFSTERTPSKNTRFLKLSHDAQRTNSSFRALAVVGLRSRNDKSRQKSKWRLGGKVVPWRFLYFGTPRVSTVHMSCHKPEPGPVSLFCLPAFWPGSRQSLHTQTQGGEDTRFQAGSWDSLLGAIPRGLQYVIQTKSKHPVVAVATDTSSHRVSCSEVLRHKAGRAVFQSTTGRDQASL